MEVEWWPAPLTERNGAPKRLCGIQVLHDFPWYAVFDDGRTQFRNGKVLAETVLDACPEGLTAALLLTQRADAQQGFLETPTHFLFVINVDEYRRTSGNAALSYLANHLPVDAAHIGEFADLSILGDPDEVRALLARHLDVDHVATWLNEDDERKRRVAELVDMSSMYPATVERALDSLNALDELETEHLERLVAFTIRMTQGEHRVELIRRVTEDEQGRTEVSSVLQERVAQRLDDAREALRKYEALLDDQGATETVMQKFLTENPLLFGLQYANIRPQQSTPSGTVDFLLERFDGYNDVVELKGPSDEIIKVLKTAGQASPTPHKYRLGKELAQALAQTMAYRDRLTRHPETAEEFHRIKNPRDPWLFIVLGRLDRLEEHQRFVLRELNKSLHRAEVLPYDVLARRAHAVIDNLVKYLEGPAAPAD